MLKFNHLTVFYRATVPQSTNDHSFLKNLLYPTVPPSKTPRPENVSGLDQQPQSVITVLHMQPQSCDRRSDSVVDLFELKYRLTSCLNTQSM